MTKNTMASWFLILLASTGCLELPSEDSRTNVVSRIGTPDSLIDAIITRDMSGGATVSTMYYVSVVPQGSSQFDQDVLRADKVYGTFRTCWTQPRELTIYSDSAQIWNFTNFSYVRLPDSLHHIRVRLVERPFNTNDSSHCASL